MTELVEPSTLLFLGARTRLRRGHVSLKLNFWRRYCARLLHLRGLVALTWDLRVMFLVRGLIQVLLCLENLWGCNICFLGFDCSLEVVWVLHEFVVDLLSHWLQWALHECLKDRNYGYFACEKEERNVAAEYDQKQYQ